MIFIIILKGYAHGTIHRNLKIYISRFLQGISEILPISSSGHLMVAQHLLKVNESAIATFTIFLHFASLLALLIFLEN